MLNFKGALWNSTQNILHIRWKMQFLYRIEILRVLRFKISQAFSKRCPAPWQLHVWLNIFWNVIFHWISLNWIDLWHSVREYWVHLSELLQKYSIISFHYIIGNVTLPGDHLWDCNRGAVSLSKIAASIFMAQHDNGNYCWAVFSAAGAEYHITV